MDPTPPPRSFDLDGPTARLLVKLGVAASAAGNPEQAGRLFGQAVDLDATAAIGALEAALSPGLTGRRLLRHLADAYWQAARYDDAVELVGLDPALAERLIDRLFILEGSCRCCGSCCQRLRLFWDGQPIRTAEALHAFWRSDPALGRFQPIRLVPPEAFAGLSSPPGEIWAALHAAGFLDDDGATRPDLLRARELALPGGAHSPGELREIQRRIGEAAIQRDAEGCFRFECRSLTPANRCDDHANRPALCRDFPRGRSLRVPECGFTRRVDPSLTGMHPLSMVRLMGWYALEHGLCRSFIPHAREALRLVQAPPPRLAAAVRDQIGRCQEKVRAAQPDRENAGGTRSTPPADPAGA